jgi:hypothetical protein
LDRDLQGCQRKDRASKAFELGFGRPSIFPIDEHRCVLGLDMDAIRGMQFFSKHEFINLFNSTIMNLRDLPVFGTTSEVVRCTKFLITRVHDRSIWLDQRYLIPIDEIHQLTGLSLEGEDVAKGFQGPRKHVKKKGEVSLYEKFHT